jgi:NADPH:quinone reductase-like Zn-dependent oxidoreductase
MGSSEVLTAHVTEMGRPDPLTGLRVGERPEPEAPPGWVVADVTHASVNPHDLGSLRGFVRERFPLPVTLGCDGAGHAPDGQEVVFYPVLRLFGGLQILSDGVDGTFAPRIALPAEHLVPKPANLTLAEASVLGVAWLTAWRMLFTRAALRPGERVLVQGASGGVATAAALLAAAAGAHVTVSSRRTDARAAALDRGADLAVEPGARLPERVDVVVETVGAATWSHTLRSVAPGGRVVVAGASSGDGPPAELVRVALQEITVLGSTMGTLEELTALCRFVEEHDLHPPVSQVVQGVEQVPDALRALDAGEQLGKIVVAIDR